jgi:hypothetical protein
MNLKVYYNETIYKFSVRQKIRKKVSLMEPPLNDHRKNMLLCGNMAFLAFQKITFDINFHQNGMPLHDTNVSFLFRHCLKITGLWIFKITTVHHLGTTCRKPDSLFAHICGLCWKPALCKPHKNEARVCLGPA